MMRLQLCNGLRAIAIAVLCLPLLFGSGCGFTPVYQQGKARQSLESITINAANTREAQLFKARLSDSLKPGGAGESRYQLTPKLTITRQALSIDVDGTVQRYRLIGNASYRLTDLESGELLMDEEVERFMSYSVSDADFSTFVASRDVREQLVRSLAEEVRLALIAHFT